MKKFMKLSILVLLFVVLGANVKAESLGQFGSPSVLINAGDSGGTFITEILCGTAGMQFDVGQYVNPEQLEKGFGCIEGYKPLFEYNSDFPLGTKYETVLVAISMV